MSDGIKRDDDAVFDLVIDTLANIESASVIPFKGMAGGEIHFLSDEGINLLTWHTSHDGVAFVPAMSEDGSEAVTQTIAGPGGYPIPGSLYGCHYLKATANVAGNAHLVMKG